MDDLKIKWNPEWDETNSNFTEHRKQQTQIQK